MASCKYHPLSTATYHCAHCQVDYCNHCIDESEYRRNSNADYLCFVCGSAIHAVQDDSSVQPFWRNLGALYRYPLGASSIVTILAMSFLVVTIAYIFQGTVLLLFMFQLLPSVCMLLYCFACLRQTASGDLEAPDFTRCFAGKVNPIISVIFMWILAYLATVFVSSTLGSVAALFLLIFFVVTFPAALMVLTIDDSLLPALDPSRLIELIKVTGTSYIVLLILLTVMILSLSALESLLGGFSSSFSGLFMQSVISNYYYIVSFHLLGYLVHQHSHSLGLGGSRHTSIDTLRSEQEWLEAKVATLVKAGQYDEACRFSRRQIDQNPAQMWHWARCYKLLCLGTDEDALRDFAPRYFDKLAISQQEDDLADAYVLLKKRLPRYVIDDENRSIDIAERLFDIGRYSYVVELLDGFYTRSKNLEHINQALKLLAESYKMIPGNDKKAKLYQDIYDMRNKSA